MTQVTVPSAGDPITVAWGQSVANHANKLIPVIVSADVSKTSSSMSTVTGLTFPCVNGKVYTVNLVLTYTVGGTSTGIAFGFDHPGGAARIFSTIFGNASATGSTSEWLTAVDTATGTTTTDAASTRQALYRGTYSCTADGTFSVRYARGGTSTTVTVSQGSGGLVVSS